ncbi:NAD(P)/FAD-dependent oxidoreductase [Halobacillus mangrovi]|uniref:Pyridine nucleotide-disulfide oxidoreductase n=1 Tax=Halobacillus mangrovi TaxID=402384 RepID=A0A1W5ZWV0_9BACI|nr:NAD(P)/FAD-dependent oxidoreductase [Halobacillus mangrovi]ARI77764.1 pyridine nucleotide-disulfide oxidoreductase [Halobacillus mangrovi]
MTYDCIIIGGGIGGLQASIQLGRYNRKVLTIDAGEGRSTLCRKYNNILGFPNGVSGQELRDAGVTQAKGLGIEFLNDEVTRLHKESEGFTVSVEKGTLFKAKTVLLATGVKDNLPAIPGLKECLGLSLYICPDCDGYEITDKKTIVIGSGDAGAAMAEAIHYWSEDITYINHDGADIAERRRTELENRNIPIRNETIEKVNHQNGAIESVETTSGKIIKVEKGFLAFGGNKVQTELASRIGAEMNEKHHLIIDSRTKMTSVPDLWAAGDIGAHSELVTAAMGEGAIAAIWIQKRLLQGTPSM